MRKVPGKFGWVLQLGGLYLNVVLEPEWVGFQPWFEFSYGRWGFAFETKLLWGGFCRKKWRFGPDDLTTE